MAIEEFSGTGALCTNARTVERRRISDHAHCPKQSFPRGCGLEPSDQTDARCGRRKRQKEEILLLYHHVTISSSPTQVVKSPHMCCCRKVGHHTRARGCTSFLFSPYRPTLFRNSSTSHRYCRFALFLISGSSSGLAIAPGYRPPVTKFRLLGVMAFFFFSFFFSIRSFGYHSGIHLSHLLWTFPSLQYRFLVTYSLSLYHLCSANLAILSTRWAGFFVWVMVWGLLFFFYRSRCE